MKKSSKPGKSALKHDLFAHEAREQKIAILGDPLQRIEAYIQFSALAAEVDRIAPRPFSVLNTRIDNNSFRKLRKTQHLLDEIRKNGQILEVPERGHSSIEGKTPTQFHVAGLPKMKKAA